MDIIRVMLIDQFPIISAGLQFALAKVDNMRLVCQTADIEAIPNLLENQRPHVIILGIINPKGNNLSVLQFLNSLPFQAKIIVLTTGFYAEEVLDCLRIGAHGYLSKNIEVDEIPAIINSVLAGNIVISHYIKDSNQQSGKEALSHISKREMEVLRLLKKGYNNKEIAQKLYISQSTANTYIRRIIDKLNFKSRNDLLLYVGALHNIEDDIFI